VSECVLFNQTECNLKSFNGRVNKWHVITCELNNAKKDLTTSGLAPGHKQEFVFVIQGDVCMFAPPMSFSLYILL
jgi:hypothetical protein